MLGHTTKIASLVHLQVRTKTQFYVFYGSLAQSYIISLIVCYTAHFIEFTVAVCGMTICAIWMHLSRAFVFFSIISYFKRRPQGLKYIFTCLLLVASMLPEREH